MLTTIVCFVALSGSVNAQKLTLYYTQSDVEALVSDLGLTKPTHSELQKQACNHLQLAVEIAMGE